MRETITRVTGIVATCVCTVAMLLASVLVPQQRAAAADSSAASASVPEYCGDNGIYMITSTGEVYEAFVPDSDKGRVTATDGDVTLAGSTDGTADSTKQTSANCFIPLSYLPGNVTTQYTTGKRRGLPSSIGTGVSKISGLEGHYNAIGADTTTGTLWAVLEVTNRALQVYRLDGATRAKYASQPNPAIANSTTDSNVDTKSWWEAIGEPITKNSANVSLSAGLNVFGGAVNQVDHKYYFANLITSNRSTLVFDIYSVPASANSSNDISVKRVTMSASSANYLGPKPFGDIEFDNNGNMTILLSQATYSSTNKDVINRRVRVITISSSNVNNGTFTPTSDVYNFGKGTSYKYGNVEVQRNTNLQVDGLAYSDSSNPTPTVSMYGAAIGNSSVDTSNPTGMSLYNLNMSDGTYGDIFDFPTSPAHTTCPAKIDSSKTDTDGSHWFCTQPSAENYSKWILTNPAWGAGSTYTQSSTSNDEPRYYFYSSEIMDIAKGGRVTRSQLYSGSYQFTKVDATSGKALEGAKFTLWPNTSNTDCANQTVPTTTDSSKITGDSNGNLSGSEQATSGSDGSVKFSEVPLGVADSPSSQTSKSFCLVETATSDSSAYELDSTPKSVVIQPSTVETITTGSNVFNTRKTGSISWTKVDASDNGTKLGGSEWQVTYTPDKSVTGATGDGYTKTVKDCASTNCSVSSGYLLDEDTSEGSFKLSGLAWGKYTVTETTAPEGYELPSGKSYTFYVGPSTLGGSYEGLNPGSNRFEDPRKSGTIAWGKYSTMSLTTADWGEVVPSALPETGLAGSVWKLTVTGGQTYTIVDCVASAGTCASQAKDSSTLYDTDSRTGVFSVTIPGSLWHKTIRLSEATAPTGYKTNTGHKDFTIDASNLTPKAVEIGDDMVNGPALPMAGGLSQQIFQWAAAGLIGLALLLATALWIKRKGGARVK